MAPVPPAMCVTKSNPVTRARKALMRSPTSQCRVCDCQNLNHPSPIAHYLIVVHLSLQGCFLVRRAAQHPRWDTLRTYYVRYTV